MRGLAAEKQSVHRLDLSAGAKGVLGFVCLTGVTLLVVEDSSFPSLHTILDTCMLLLSGMLALQFWDLDIDEGDPLTRRLAVAFAITSFAEIIHGVVTVEWTGSLAFVARASEALRPTTWPPAAYILPIGIACSIWLKRRGTRDLLGLVAALALLCAIFFAAFYWLPRYTTSVGPGITRPTLLLVPALWAVVAWLCWARRGTNRMFPPLALMAAVIFLSSVSMLYSRSPHDTQAMVAHLGRVGGYLALLLCLLQMGSSDMRQLVKTERELAQLNQELEERVRCRTTQLVTANLSLESEMAVRRKSEAKVQAHLERLNLLHHITRAVGGREDLRSIYQVVLRTLEENLSFDFGCICDYDEAKQDLTVVHVGTHSESLALELALTERAHVSIDANGLSSCIQGKLVYEPDIAEIKMPFPARLARAGLRSLVAAPLQVESKVFGVFVAARRESHSFSSGECEFLRQLSEHVALAAHQAQLYSSLQQAYDELRQTQQAVMQQERLRALGQMASGIAHDINNALSPVMLYTEMLLTTEPNLSDRARKNLETVQRAIGDAAQTVGRMREFYRQREPELKLAAVDINTLVRQVIDITRARWSDMPQQQGVVIDMRTELMADLPVIAGVESEIREALINLIFNAVDAMPSGGTLTMRTLVTRQPQGHTKLASRPGVLVEVSDTGIGMDEQTRIRCAEPFFTTKGDRGTGLGLASVYGMVQRNDADLDIESVVGKGTTVRLSFAARPDAVPGSGQPNDASSLPPRMRILIVDDDPLVLKALRDVLEADGHVVFSANSGETGIEAFEVGQEIDDPFAVVITDLGMPNIDGRKVAKAIKTASPSTPVILLTGWGERLKAEGDIPPEVDHVLSKPPKLRELRATLRICSDGTATAKSGNSVSNVS